mmetsp:Transcript_56587/g.124074  ORF Transcript_56587/g.124074 Transcript_56587/m.124074 type:complete len:236 (-) Transcript_56587:488-1195(-)
MMPTRVTLLRTRHMRALRPRVPTGRHSPRCHGAMLAVKTRMVMGLAITPATTPTIQHRALRPGPAVMLSSRTPRLGRRCSRILQAAWSHPAVPGTRSVPGVAFTLPNDVVLVRLVTGELKKHLGFLSSKQLITIEVKIENCCLLRGLGLLCSRALPSTHTIGAARVRAIHPASLENVSNSPAVAEGNSEQPQRVSRVSRQYVPSVDVDDFSPVLKLHSIKLGIRRVPEHEAKQPV